MEEILLTSLVDGWMDGWIIYIREFTSKNRRSTWDIERSEVWPDLWDILNVFVNKKKLPKFLAILIILL